MDFGVFAFALYNFGIHYLISNLFVLIAGNVVNYILSVGWIFASEKRKMENHLFWKIVIFVLISLFEMGLNEILMYISACSLLEIPFALAIRYLKWVANSRA